MNNLGIVSYNINCNFTNYGSALQSWALSQAIDKIGAVIGVQSKLIDYCPNVLEDCDVLNPFKRMWDTDEESRRMVELTMPAIIENYKKFETFYSLLMMKELMALCVVVIPFSVLLSLRALLKDIMPTLTA